MAYKKLKINVSEGVPSWTTQINTKVSSFGPFCWPPSHLHTRTHERNYTNYL